MRVTRTSVRTGTVRCLVATLTLSLASAGPASAHAGPVAPAQLWGAWNFDGYIVSPLVAAMLLYARGLHRMWTHAGVGRGVRVWQARCFAGGVAALVVALISPLDALGGSLFAAHMTQHVLLMGVAAPLIVLGTPLTAFVWALPRRGRRLASTVLTRRSLRTIGGWLAAPAAAWLLHAAAIWIWHVPALYSATVTNDLVHAAQHTSFMLTAVLFWWALRDRTRHGLAVLYLFTTAVHSSLLGALLAFAPAAYYLPYEATAPAWGLTALEDQQIGGFIMWVPAGLVYFGAALALLALWLRQSDRAAARAAWTATAALALALGACGPRDEPARAVVGGDPARGQRAIAAYGCGACHEIAGVRNAGGRVGPSLTGISRQVYIAGHLPNEPEAMVRWIMNPQAFRSPTAMPNLGVSEADARDIAAYLYRVQ